MKRRLFPTLCFVVFTSIVSAQETVELMDFESISYSDSLITDMKIVDYGSDDESERYRMGTSRNYYEAYTLKAVGGPRRAVDFINKWLMVNQTDHVTPPITVEKVNSGYGKLLGNGLRTIGDVLKSSSSRFLQGELLEESSFETGSYHINGVDVVWNTGRLLTFQDHGTDYSAGAAHGMPWNQYVTFDMTQLRQLMLDDMIEQEYREVVLRMISEELEDGFAEELANHDIDFPSNEPGLTAEGIIFVYSAYEIGPYSLGMPEVILEYDKVWKYMTEKAKALIE